MSTQTRDFIDANGRASTTQDAIIHSAAGWTDSCDPYTQNQQSQHWVTVTEIEDDDLMFGGKPLCTWYEEDRRRYSTGEDGAPSPSSSIDDEELHRGRQRDRPQYDRPHRKHQKKTSYSSSESEEEKKQH